MADKKGGYGIVYREVMRSKELTPEAKAIYAYLCSFAGTSQSCYPGVELMRSELQMGTDRFYKHMHLLTNNGIVRKVQERKGNRWGNTVYILNHKPDFQLSQNEHTENQLSQNEHTENQLSQNEHTENQHTHNNNINNNSSNNNSLNNKNNFGQRAGRICHLLNLERESRRSKGRLQLTNKSKEILENLINQGFTWELIEEVASQLGTKINSEWCDLEKAVLDAHKKGGK